MIEIVAEQGRDELAKGFVAKMRNSDEHLVEFVESVQPPVPRDQKWVLIVSTLFGCPGAHALHLNDCTCGQG